MQCTQHRGAGRGDQSQGVHTQLNLTPECSRDDKQEGDEKEKMTEEQVLSGDGRKESTGYTLFQCSDTTGNDKKKKRRKIATLPLPL